MRQIETEMGGYFGLEGVARADSFPQKGVRLNSGRNALEYILKRMGNVRRVYVPRYTCHSVLTPLLRLQIPYEYYAVDDQLEIDSYAPPSPKDGEYVLYTNYFGVKEQFVDILSERYNGHLIVDNALALYSPVRNGVPSFYSPRKFSGLPDGGIACVEESVPLLLERDTSYESAGFLLQAVDCGLKVAANAAEINEQRLSDAPLRSMSRLTETLMGMIDYRLVAERRCANFSILHQELAPLNKLRINPASVAVPFCYPFRTNLTGLRDELLEHNVHLPVFWHHLLDNPALNECRAVCEILPLPIDQRLEEKDMSHLLELIHRYMR